MNNFQIADTVKCGVKMSGLYSDREFKQGEIVHLISGETFDKPSKYTVQIGSVHFLDKNIMFMNHSCNPNTEISGNKIIAKSDISKGEELTFDYNTTESFLSSPFICDDCGKVIKGNSLHSIVR